ncbi:MAG: hypothetical protein ACKV2V_11900 [Blastocatellia bacterium]
MLIQFPGKYHAPIPAKTKTRPVGLYVLLAFVFLYLAAVFLVRQHMPPPITSSVPTVVYVGQTIVDTKK